MDITAAKESINNPAIRVVFISFSHNRESLSLNRMDAGNARKNTTAINTNTTIIAFVFFERRRIITER